MKHRNGLKFNFNLFLRRMFLVIADSVLFMGLSVLTLLLRYEFQFSALMETDFLWNIIKMFPITAVVTVAVFALFGLYNSLWEYASERELTRIFTACIITCVLQTAIQFLANMPVPRSFVVIQFILLTFGITCIRFSYRFFRHNQVRHNKVEYKGIRTMIVGAGEAGAIVLREMQRSLQAKNAVLCIIDDDSHKIGSNMYGVPIVGGTDRIPSVARDYKIEEIILAIPSASAKKRSQILEICNKTSCKLRMLPGIFQLVNGEVSIQKIRDVQIEDLLARDSIQIENSSAYDFYTGKTVLVTGGGGSIGSELCRQIAKCNPCKLVILDIYENNAYDIQQELHQVYGEKLNLVVEIASVRDKERLDQIFRRHRPNVVFHAAAHKHVPLMEHSCEEAIKNNVFGTYNAADMAEKYGVSKFILISTDKAVNPTNIMGASKRMCEMVVQSRIDSKTNFAAVRFGNVLGSNGSVIPLFKRQIASGGPITITDKRIIRYFMTIREASQLVMEAGAMAQKGELFVLDMGKPVRIYDLAINMIKLSGFVPEVDIKIEEIGLRPGEKLYEELLMKNETLSKTENDLIFIEKDEALTRAEIDNKLQCLQCAIDASYRGQPDAVKNAFHQVVPTFLDPKEVNEKAAQAREMQLVH